MVRRTDVLKESGVIEDVDCGLIFQYNSRHGDGEIVLMESFAYLDIGDTTISLIQCGEGSFQLALGQYIGYHRETFKKVISIGIYLKGRHESVRVVVGHFLGADIFMCLAGLSPVRALVGKVAKFLTPEALDLSEVPRIPLAIIGVNFSVG